MTGALHCDICSKFAVENYAVGWMRTEPVSTYIRTVEQRPIEHVCDICWSRMLLAVSPAG